ncbi:MAG: glycosyltransferase, partial [Candidatus Spechtbacterales bacterium]
MQKIKILFAINQMTIGGSQRIIADQINLLYRNMFDPFLVTLLPEEKDSFLKDINLSPGKKVFFDFSSSFNVISWFHLVRYIRKEQFDIIFCNLILANTIVRLAAYIAGARNIIVAEHNVYPDKTTRQLFTDKILSFITKKILAVSFDVKNFLTRSGISASKIDVLYNGINLEKFEVSVSREKLGFSEDEVIIISVGRVSIQKAYDVLIDTAKNLRDKTKIKFRFIIVGKSDTQYAHSLKAKVKELDLEDLVEFWGVRYDIPELLSSSDIFFMPSRWEGFCIALAEAMAAGIPFVANNVGFVSEEDRKYNGIKSGEYG